MSGNLQQNLGRQGGGWKRVNLTPVQKKWSDDMVRALGWESKRQSQETLRTDMAQSFKTIEEATFAAGEAAELMNLDPKASKQWKRYLSDRMGFEQEKPPRKDPLLNMLRASAQAYIDHFNNDYNTTQKKSKTNLTKRTECEKTLSELRKLDARDEFARLGEPPWDSKGAMKAAGLKATLDLESIPGGQARKLDGGGVNPAFWVNKAGGGDQGTKTFLFKPESAYSPDIGGLPKGAEPAREALTGRAADMLKGMTGLDFAMPETHVIAVGKDKFAEGSLEGTPFGKDDTPVRGSLQQFAATDGELRDQPMAQMRKISPASCQKIAILDMVTLNMDRHSGNLMVNGATTETPDVVPIDHGLTFPTKDSLADLPANIGNDKNVLLKLPGSYEDFTPEMLKSIELLDPDGLAEGLRRDIATIEEVVPGTQGKVADECVKISRRSAMFLKKAAAALPPAILQVALGQDAESLLDPGIDDQEFDRRATAAIQKAGQQAGAIKEYFLMLSDEERKEMKSALKDNGWPADRGLLNERWLMGNLKVALKLYNGDVKNPNMVRELEQEIGVEELKAALATPMALNKAYEKFITQGSETGKRPIDLDERTSGEAVALLKVFPTTPITPRPTDANQSAALRDQLRLWREFNALGGTDALDAEIETLDWQPGDAARIRANLLTAVGQMRQAAAVHATAPQLPDDKNDKAAKLKWIDYIEKIVAALPADQQAGVTVQINELRLAVQQGAPRMRRVIDLKELFKEDITALKDQVVEAARTHLNAVVDAAVKTMDGPPELVSPDLYQASVETTRTMIRAGAVLNAQEEIAKLKRSFNLP